ncbi:menaquinone reductase multiheme cytochrome c subunit QrcA [Desulfohalobium retbaense]|uniref:Molybdopterin oxidoreductase, cytochrome subunit n=1 Tax=Desulfohalobium retbaense (strain ATCC 49708 / DSM 5692 / JCM 16813 / HR100) TaxID=485915 RepID=C8WZU7_DESRD|nr:menaquinone reductase multiheme cytochrome c subunit QrcA [Desulfohalobium retbaense]ACV67572.1 molybdopterin oxidoreductase, cytochrome subunit [Desulfohalobium retbaense DSM 5692]
MAKRKRGGALPFLLGLAAALIFGWWGFPQILYSQKDQPFRFSHEVHEMQGMACSDCHYYREDGSFAGLPSLSDCTQCHFDVMTGDPAEKTFIEEYVYPEKEIDWKVYQKQPDNVYFSHIAHDDYDCSRCHPDMAGRDDMPTYKENRITGYSKDTMKMWQCERCHAENGASNACYVCHK